MKYYATLLNLKEAHEFSLDEEDIFDPLLQESIMDRIMCGSGDTEEEALQVALENLVDEGVIEVCKCENGVKEIITKIPGKQALRHLWLHHDEYHDEYRLYPMPYHDDLVDFCRRHKLTDEAARELESLFDTVTHTDN